MNSAAFQVLRKEPHVSFSAISTYSKCPRQYEFRYLLGQDPEHRPGALAFGTAVHEALAQFYTALRDGEDEPTADDLHEVFERSWLAQLDGDLPVLLGDKETPDGLLETARKMLARFLDEAERPVRVLGVEEPFSVEIIDPLTGEILPERLVGVFDAVVETDRGLRVLEHKTGARRWSEDRIATDLQLTAYHWVAPQVGLDGAEVEVQLLTKTKEPKLEVYHPSRTPRDHDDLLRTISGVLTAIRAGAIWPVRDWHCRGCQYAGACIAS